MSNYKFDLLARLPSSQMAAQSFTAAAGHRAGVPKIAIVVTDGQSNNKGLTATESEKARKAGKICQLVPLSHILRPTKMQFTQIKNFG